jgi:hypothetical protein
MRVATVCAQRCREVRAFNPECGISESALQPVKWVNKYIH